MEFAIRRGHMKLHLDTESDSLVIENDGHLLQLSFSSPEAFRGDLRSLAARWMGHKVCLQLLLAGPPDYPIARGPPSYPGGHLSSQAGCYP